MSEDATMTKNDLHRSLSQIGLGLESIRQMLERGESLFSAGRAYEALGHLQGRLHLTHQAVLTSKITGSVPDDKVLELTTRTENCLKNSGLTTPVTLSGLDMWLSAKTEGELLDIPNFGRKSFNELKEVMTANGAGWPVRKAPYQNLNGG